MERLKGHVCYSGQINEASVPDSETSERQSGAYVDRRPRDYGTLARILRKRIFGLGKHRRGTDEDGWYTGTLPVKEVEKAIKSMKRGQAAGPDEIPNELLKLGEYTVLCTRVMNKVIEQVW